jgi:hypothetical protein
MPWGKESKKGDSGVKWVPESYDISIFVQRLSCTVSNLLKKIVNTFINQRKLVFFKQGMTIFFGVKN